MVINRSNQMDINSDVEMDVDDQTSEPKNYHELLQTIKSLEDMPIDGDLVSELHAILMSMNQLVDIHKIDKEKIVMDSVLMRRVTELNLKCCTAVNNKSNSYNADQFAKLFKRNFGNVFENLTKVTNTILIPVPSFEYIPVPQLYDPETEEGSSQAVKTARQAPRKRVDFSEYKKKEKKPEAVTQIEEEEINSRDIRKLSSRILKKFEQSSESSLDLRNTLVSRKSFAKTVENMFFFSFLIRDKAFGITIDDNQSVCISKIPEEDQDRSSDDINADKSDQFIASFDYVEWQNVCNNLTNSQEPISDSESDGENHEME